MPQERELPDLSEALAVLLDRKYLIALVTLLAASLALGASYLIRPVFRAEVLTAPAADDKSSLGMLAAQFGGLADMAGISLGGQGNRATAIATLKSRVLTEAFLKDHDLLPLLYESKWDADNKRWKSEDPDKVPTLWDAYEVFDRKIRNVQEDRKSGLITVSIEWHDPQQAADWANELVRLANAKLQHDTIAEGEKTVAYLEQQLAKASVVEVRLALYNLIEAQTKKIAVANAREEFGFKVIDPAVVPKRKIRPNRVLILFVGAFVGLICGSSWLLLRHFRQ